jgi:hypothetical protein
MAPASHEKGVGGFVPKALFDFGGTAQRGSVIASEAKQSTCIERIFF